MKRHMQYTQNELNEILTEHDLYLRTYGEEGKRADLCGADLRGADLRGANLKNVDLDFSCLPLWCGSLDADFDDRQIAQFAYHIVKAGLASKNVSDKTKNELKK